MTERRLIALLALGLLLSIAAQWLVPHHAGFAISHYFGFYAASALAGAIVIGCCVKILPLVFRRQTPLSNPTDRDEAKR